jgi:hypothetical protein
MNYRNRHKYKERKGDGYKGFHPLYSSANVIGAITSREMGWAERRDVHLEFQPENLNERYYSGDLGVNGWMILNVKR